MTENDTLAEYFATVEQSEATRAGQHRKPTRGDIASPARKIIMVDRAHFQRALAAADRALTSLGKPR